MPIETAHRNAINVPLNAATRPSYTLDAWYDTPGVYVLKKTCFRILASYLESCNMREAATMNPGTESCRKEDADKIYPGM